MVIENWELWGIAFFASCLVIYSSCQWQIEEDLFKTDIVLTTNHKVFLNFYFGLIVLPFNVYFSWSLTKGKEDYFFFASYLSIMLTIQLLYFGIKFWKNYHVFYQMRSRISKVLGQEFKLIHVEKVRPLKLSLVKITYQMGSSDKVTILMEALKEMNYKEYSLEVEKALLSEIDPFGNKSFDYFVTQGQRSS